MPLGKLELYNISKTSHFHAIFVYKLVSYCSFPKSKEARRWVNMFDSVDFGSHLYANYLWE